MTFRFPHHVFAKNEKDNLTRTEQSALVELSKMLIASYGGNDERL